MTNFYQKNKKAIDNLIFLVLIIVAAYLFFTVLWGIVAPFFIGLIIALLLTPAVKFLERKIRFPGRIAAILMLVIFMAAMSSLGVWVVSLLARQVATFAENLPSHAEQFAERLEEANTWLARQAAALPGGLDLPQIQDMALGAGAALIADGLRDGGLRFVGGVPGFLITILLALVSAYFFIADRKRILDTLAENTPEWLGKKFAQTKNALQEAAGGFFRAQAIIMSMVGVVSIGGLLILRSPYALLLGLLLAVLDFIPALGPGLLFVPWALVSLIAGDMRMAIGLMVLWGVTTVVRQVMQPKVLGSTMGMHPLASLASIFVGWRIFGIFGLILGPMLLMVLLVVHQANTAK
jgi:sporulation integral membrane protein YtvI